MSGTSLDGIDGVLISIRNERKGLAVSTLAHVHWRYPKDFVETVREIAAEGGLIESAYFGAAWSEAAAKVIKKLCDRAHVSPSNVEVVGAHGQTVAHLPTPRKFLGNSLGVTIQLADISRLAIRAGIPVVGNFRSADVALGGQGAPLVPHAHRILFGSKNKSIAVQNMGGIGNVTLLKQGRVVSAFDTGPGNIWIDTVMRWKTAGKKTFDRNGALARKGKVDRVVLLILLSHPYFRKRPPKSTGWEEFGKAYLQKVKSHLMNMKLEDALATVTHATALATAEAYRRFVFPKAKPSELILAGGGAKNQFLRGLSQSTFRKLM